MWWTAGSSRPDRWTAPPRERFLVGPGDPAGTDSTAGGALMPERQVKSGWSLGLVVFLVLASGAAYWGFLGWDDQRDLDPVTGRLTGPYQPRQVTGCGAVVLFLSVLGGWVREVGPTWVALGTTLVVSFSITGITDPMNQGLWPIGASMLAAVTYPGTFAAAATTRW